MEHKDLQISNLRKKLNHKKLESSCKIDNKAHDITTKLQILVHKIENVQNDQIEREWLSSDLETIKVKVIKLHEYAYGIMLENQAYYKCIYERKNESDQVY